MRPTTEKEYSDALFAYMGKEDVQRVYINPVIERLIKRHRDGKTADYETAHKALKRAVKEMAARWKLEHYMSIPLSTAARTRVWDAIATSVMEIYFIRRKQATGADVPQRP